MFLSKRSTWNYVISALVPDIPARQLHSYVVSPVFPFCPAALPENTSWNSLLSGKQVLLISGV